MGIVPILKMKRVLGMDGSGDGCTTSRYLIPLNCTVKMVKMGNFTLCVFYLNKKSGKQDGNIFICMFVCIGIKYPQMDT